MPPNKYRSVTHPLIFVLVFPILFVLYGLALFIALAAFLIGAFTCCCCDNCIMDGLLVVGDSLIEASIKIIEGSMRINDEQIHEFPSHASTSSNPPDQTRTQYPMLAAHTEMPNNQYSNSSQGYQLRNSQQRADSTPTSSVSIIVDRPIMSGFTYEELLAATNRFSAQNFLGEGGFGFVHRGMLPDGREVAVKQIKSDNTWGQREFRAEVDVLSRVHHRHLVQYFGCCMTREKRMIVCEYMPNKTVDYHLHCQHEGTIDWPTRLKIAIGAAKGLAYLHEECQPRIVHRDIKAANILLDHSFEAKVADFGMCKFFPDGISLIIATNLIGTRGYLAPECSVGEIREKSDTFSFGVVLLELITGKKPIITRPVSSEESFPFDTLANWAKPLLAEALQNGNYIPLVDSRLRNVYNYDEMRRMMACAAACVRHSQQERPSMSKVALVLAGHTSPDDLSVIVESTELDNPSVLSMGSQPIR